MRRDYFRLKWFYPLCVLLISQATALAMSFDAASLKVVVLDPNGEAVTTSQIQIKSVDGREQTLGADYRGEAVFSSLVPGNYRIYVGAPGFAPQEINIIVKSGHNFLEVRLEIAGLNEVVTVEQSEREKQTDPRNAAFVTILTENQIANLPDDPGELESTLRQMAGPGATIRVNGFAGGRLPPKSQIRQVRFRRNSYAAEYHRAGFTGVEIITKPGVDTWHGSLGFGFRDESVNARNAFAPKRTPEQLRRLELTLDAPLLRNRTSFFGAIEGTLSFDTQTIVAALPGGNLVDTVNRPSRSLYASARLAHSLSKTHTLGAVYERNAQQSGNLGVGNFNLPERAYSSDQVENFLRLSDTGTIGRRLFNEIRLQFHLQSTELRSANAAPAVLVLDAFNRGGAQRQSDDQAREIEIADNVDFGFGRHAMRLGLLFEAGFYRNDSFNNAGGTFTFTSLDDFRAARPTTFAQRIGGNPLRFTQYQLGGYWQDDLRLNQGLTLSFGLRYEWQSRLDDHNNFAPRIGLAWSPFKDGRTTIRGGAGIFYDWVGADIFSQILSLNGQRQFDIIIRNPGFPDPATGGNQLVLPPSRFQRDLKLLNPYVGQASVSVERQLGHGIRLKTSYFYQHGIHLLRGRDINAPIPGRGRPDLTAGTVIQVESSALSKTHLFNVNLSNNLSKNLYWLLDYSLSKSVNEADGPFALPVDNFDLRSELGPSLEDARHRLFATLGLELFKGLRLGTTFYAKSALPYNITTGFDNNGDTIFNDRPAGIARNSARGAPQWDLSMRLSWLIAFGEGQASRQSQGQQTIRVSSSDVGALASELAASEKKWRMNLYIQTFNILNNVNLINYSGIQTSPFYGRPVASLPGRRIETGVRFSF